MRNDKLLDAIGQVDDSLIDEAEHIRRFPMPQKASAPWKRWAGMAAALILVVGLGYSTLIFGPHFLGSFSGASSGAPVDNEMPAGDIAAESDGYSMEKSDVSAETPTESIAMESGSGWGADDPTVNASAEDIPEEAVMEDVPDNNAGDLKDMTQPPKLYVSGTAILSGNSEWTISHGEEKETLIACGASPLDKQDTITRIRLYGADTVKFETVDDGLKEASAYCYPGDSWGNDQAEPIELAVEGHVITLPDNSQDWILVVTLTWEDENYSGRAEYDFLVQQD